jgi:hypothetical protein
MHNSDNDSGDGEWVNDLSFLDHLPADDSSFSVRPGSTKQSFHVYAIIPDDVIYGVAQPGEPPAPSRGARAPRGTRSLGPLPPSGRLLLYDTINLEDEQYEVMLALFTGDTPGLYDVRGSIHPAPPVDTQGRLSLGDKLYYAEVVEGSVEFKNVEIGEDVSDVLFSLETID